MLTLGPMKATRKAEMSKWYTLISMRATLRVEFP
jgi:hypothetical protein